MAVKNPIIFRCSLCERSLDSGTSSEEKAGQFAAKERWVLGLPRGQAWCNRCCWTVGPYSPGTV